MTDTVRVVCTDRDTHPSRELAVLRRRDEIPEIQESVLRQFEEAGLGKEEAAMLYEWEQADSIGRRSSRRGGYVRLATVAEFSERGPLWRFRCPTCRRDVPMRGDRLLRLLDGLLAAGRVSVDLSYLGANLA